MEEILLGSADRTILVFIPDPASTDGSGKTGLVAADLTVSYTRVETDNDVAVTDVTSSLNNLASLTAAHNDWGLLEVSNTLAPGLYRLDVADAVFASGAWYATVYVMITTSAAAATPKIFRLVAINALDSVRMGMTALPNAAADAGGGLPISDAGGLDLDSKLANTNEITAARMGALTDWIDGGRLDLLLDAIKAITDRLVSNTGTAQGGSSTTIRLAAGASSTDNIYKGQVVYIYSGAGAGQARMIESYTGATRTATLTSDTWWEDPDVTSLYVVFPMSVMSLTLLESAVDNSSVFDVLTDTNELQTDWANGGRLDLLIDTIVAATAAAAIRTALGLAAANLDNQIGDLPTNSELATAAALALTNYDPPTRLEATADKDEILTQLPAAPVKNAAFTYVIKMVDSTDHATPETGLTITMTRSIDGAAFGAATGVVTEISTGHYKVVASAADMNGDVVTHRFTASGADDLTMEFKTVS